jgi:hypothetical protein
MYHTIGESAGKIWRYLEQHGRSSFSQVVKGTKLNQRTADRAVGWLAREGKIRIEKDKNAEILCIATDKT